MYWFRRSRCFSNRHHTLPKGDLGFISRGRAGRGEGVEVGGIGKLGSFLSIDPDESYLKRATKRMTVSAQGTY